MATISAKDRELRSLQQLVARLRGLTRQRLGEGVWGLEKEPTASFSHEEIVFLFARIFQALDLDTVQEIRTQYPDCVARMDDQVKYIEFEPFLSSFRPHAANDDLGMCDYIICWVDDLQPHDDLRNLLVENEIEVIELRDIYEKTRPEDTLPPLPFRYTEDDIRRLPGKKLRMLWAFARTGESFLTKEQLAEVTGVRGRGLGGALKGFTEQAKRRDWLLRQWGDGLWEFNDYYRAMVERVLRQAPYRW